MNVTEFVQRLNAKRSGKGWKAKCPGHDDHTPSLSISEGSDGRVLVKEKRDYEGFHTRPMRWETVVQKFERLSRGGPDTGIIVAQGAGQR